MFAIGCLATSEPSLSCASRKCSKASNRSELSEAEELGEEEGPNNIARQIAQMTQRFGNAEKDPGSPRLPFHKAHSAVLF